MHGPYIQEYIIKLWANSNKFCCWIIFKFEYGITFFLEIKIFNSLSITKKNEIQTGTNENARRNGRQKFSSAFSIARLHAWSKYTSTSETSAWTDVWEPTACVIRQKSMYEYRELDTYSVRSSGSWYTKISLFFLDNCKCSPYRVRTDLYV